MQKLTRSFLLAGAAFGLAACGDDVSVTPPTPAPASVVTGVTVAPASISIAKGQTVVATAQVTVSTGTGTPDKTVTWSSADANIATVGAATGAITGVNPGTTTIRATAGGVTGAATVTVTLGVQSVSVTPTSVALQVGQKATATAVVTRDAGVAGTVTWTSATPAVATVSATGEITAVAVGTTTITAASTVDASKTAALSVTVTAVPNNLTAFSVAPTSANLGVGGTVKIVPNATTSGNPTVAYAYSSSNTAVATVDAAGLVTAVGNGSAIITTTATTNTNSLSATTTISVQSASVSIASITAGGLGLPVNIANVAGQIEVTMNVAAGNQTLDSVRVTLGGQPAATQTFTVNGAPNAPVTLSINTAAYRINADSSSTVSFVNGSTGIQAQLFTQGSSGPTASNTITITLNNADTFHARWTLPTNSTTDANGLLWYGGPSTSVTVNAVPVMYTGNTIASATLHLDNSAAGGNQLLGTDGAKVDAAAPFVQTFTTAGVELSTVAPGVSGSLRGDGNPGPTAVLGTFANSASLASARIDGVAPAAPDVFENPNGRLNNWVNDAVSFTTVQSAANPNGMIAAAIVDGGVGTVTYAAKAGAGLAGATAAADISNPTSLAASLTNGYCLVVYSLDKLGNRSAAPTTCTVATGTENFALVGVDRAAPVASYHATSLANSARINAAAIGGNFVVTLVDTGTVGNSGMLAGSPLKATVTKRDDDNALVAGDCVVGTWNATTSTCDQSTTGLAAPALPLVSTNIAALVAPGYYTFNGTAFDAAGNTTPLSSTRTVVYDDLNAASDPVLTAALFNTPLSGSTATFTANASDNLDLRDATYTMTYAGGLAGPIQYPAVVLNAFNQAPLVRSNVPSGITISGFMRQVENVTGNAPVTVGGAFKPTTLTGTVRDQSGDVSAAAATTINPASVTTGTSYTALAAASLPNSWAVSNAATNVSDGAAATPANATSVTLTADLIGPTATFNSPFTRVDFYVVSGGNLVQIGSATSPTTTDDGSAMGRRHRYSFSWTPGTTYGLGAKTVYAIGVNANGDALVSPANANITVTNP